ncbi:MAG: S-methyl-5-thioribose-1-phosphate isomerase [Oscillospiraceae bacterium]|jgi:methylthioribose-1-phosphate isomerase
MSTEERYQVVKMADDAGSITILDQTRLPGHVEYRTVSEPGDMWEAIKTLRVRGAPAIGVFAAYCMAVLSGRGTDMNTEEYLSDLEKNGKYLCSSRPTAVNLAWAVGRMLDKAGSMKNSSPDEIHSALIEEARTIDSENTEMCRLIGENGLPLIHYGDGILTHCNAGYLACCGYGTATAPMYIAHEKGISIHVYSDETRPLLQGARLTSFELSRAGIDVTSICDNMASIVMKQGRIQSVMVGADRIAANGDFANKIGTSGVAVLAKYYGIPFYTLAPSSTIDLGTPSGEKIKIEMRDPDEIRTMWYREPMIPEGVKCFNPAFDVTDHSLLTAIVTEKGIVYPPFEENLRKLF